MLLPLDFKLHLHRRPAAHLDDVANGQRGLRGEPFAACAGRTEFTDVNSWNLPWPRQCPLDRQTRGTCAFRLFSTLLVFFGERPKLRKEQRKPPKANVAKLEQRTPAGRPEL